MRILLKRCGIFLLGIFLLNISYVGICESAENIVREIQIQYPSKAIDGSTEVIAVPGCQYTFVVVGTLPPGTSIEWRNQSTTKGVWSTNVLLPYVTGGAPGDDNYSITAVLVGGTGGTGPGWEVTVSGAINDPVLTFSEPAVDTYFAKDQTTPTPQVNLKVTVTKPGGTQLEGVNVKFVAVKIDTSRVTIGSANSNNAGEASITWTVPVSSPEMFTLKAGTGNDYNNLENETTCTKKVYVVKVEIKSIKFTSDHGVLKDNNSDWTDSGTTYVEPEWVKNPARNNPITHTKNTSLTIDVTVKVEPSGIAYDLIGDGSPDDYVTFTKTGNTSTGSDQTLTVSASSALPNYITTLSKSITWKAKLTAPNPDVDIFSDTTNPDKIYVTYGTPSGSVVTEKRMVWDCATASSQSTLQGIADAIYNDFDTPPPYFDLYATAPSPLWLLMAGSEYKGQCIDQANLMKLSVELLGGTASIGFVYGSSDTDCYSTSSTAHENRKCGRILSGSDGIANTTKSGDDVQVIPVNQGEPNTTIITAGANNVLNTQQSDIQGDDVRDAPNKIVKSGADGVAQTTAQGDDVQEIQVGNGKPNTVVVTAGTDLNLQTSEAGNDVFDGHSSNGNEKIHVYAGGGWNSWEAVCVVSGKYYAIQISSNTSAVEILRTWLGSNDPSGNYQAWRYWTGTQWLSCQDPGPYPVPKP